MKQLLKIKLFFIAIFIISINLLGNEKNAVKNKSINPGDPATKISGYEDRKIGIHDGNQIRTIFYNYGVVGTPSHPFFPEPSLEWPIGSNHSYCSEFGLLVGAQVVDFYRIRRFIISESLLIGGDISSEGLPMGWEPLPGFANPGQDSIAMSNKPGTWPSDWTSWPGEFGDGVIIADQESYWVMDDRSNDEFAFFPDPEDSTIRGIGIEVTCRGYQWSNFLDEDFLIFKYNIKNIGKDILDRVVVGLFGYPSFFASVGYINQDGIDSFTGNTYAVKNMVYCFATGGCLDNYGGSEQEFGLLGIEILESPKDYYRNEIGLTSVAAPEWGTVIPGDDNEVWIAMVPGSFDRIDQNTDNCIIIGSGYFSLEPDEVKNFAIAYVFGQDKEDLLNNAKNASLKYAFLPAAISHTVTITAPTFDESISGIFNIAWETNSNSGNPLNVDVHYNLNRGDGWQLLARDVPDSGIYQWNTTQFPDGFNYQLELLVQDSLGFGRAVSDYFTVNNTNHYADPEILLLHPTTENLLSGTVNIRWRAGDADGATTTIKIYLSYDGGITWQMLSENEENDGLYLWDTQQFPNGNNYRLKLSVSDGIVEVESNPSSVFQIDNEFLTLPDSLVQHVQGDGDGTITVNIVDPFVTTGHLYQITFDDTTDTMKTYDVFDIDAGVFVVQDIAQLTPDFAGPPFDGLRLVIDDFEMAEIDTSNTRWTVGSPNVYVYITLYPNQGVPEPKDYEIRFFNTIVDSSYNGSKPTKFQVWNITDSVKTKFVFLDCNNNGEVDDNDSITPLCFIDNRARGTWLVTFFEPHSGTSVLPQPGDVFTIITLKPFSYRDIFEFRSPSAVAINENPSEYRPFKISLAQNYPNPFNSSTKICFRLPRDERVTLVIYNILGEEVIKLINDKLTAGDKSIVWNGENRFGKVVNSGLYIYCLKAGNTKLTKKMLFLK